VQFALLELIAHVEHGVDAGVTGDGTRSAGTPSAKRLAAAQSVGQSAECQAGGEQAVHLFRKRLPDVPGAQSGLDMATGSFW